MNKRSLTILAVTVVVLCLLLFLLERSEEKAVQHQGIALFKDISAEEIGGLSLRKGSDTAELIIQDGVWTVPSRSGYPADANKVRSLLLKLLDLNVSQEVTKDPKNFESLGVQDSSDKIAILGSDKKELSSLLVGLPRKGSKTAPVSTGQYVRRASSNNVYLVSDPINVVALPSSWIQTDLFSQPQTRVRRVVQETLNGDAKAQVFELKASKDSAGKTKFDLDLQPASGEQVQEPTVSSIATGLENVRIIDVSPVDDRTYDQLTTYELSTGAVYEIRSMVKDSKTYVHIATHFDPELAKVTEQENAALNEKRKQEFDAKQAEKSKDSEKDKESSKEEFVLTKPDITTADEVAKLNAIYSKWIYEVPSFQADKYRRTKTDLLKATPPAEQEQ